jgi:hypothetical protein
MWLKSAIPFRTSVLACLVILPYLFYLPPTYIEITPFVVLLLSLGVFEIVYQKIRNWILNRLSVDLSILVIPSLILLLYFQPLIQVWSKFNTFFVHLPTIRARYYLPLTWLVIITLNYLVLSKRKNRAYLINVFLGIFCTSLLINSYIPHKNTTSKFSRHPLSIKRSHTKPVILLILDEYASPAELARYTKDTKPLQFSKQLQAAGWQVSTSSYSHHKATVNSLASLFNYNINLTDATLEAPTAIRLLRQSKLLADLERKGISCYNGGIFDVGNTQAFSKIYYYEKEDKQPNFIKHLFSKSMFSLFYLLTPDAKQFLHNSSIVEHSADKLNRIYQPNLFIYLHLLMPHAPLHYKGSNSYKPAPYQNKVSSYLDYLHFTNQIVLDKLIRPLIQSQKFKIILTGDHGYRFYPDQINPYLTMTAYYGFPKSQTDQVKSVQDLGSLIYASY